MNPDETTTEDELTDPEVVPPETETADATVPEEPTPPVFVDKEATGAKDAAAARRERRARRA